LDANPDNVRESALDTPIIARTQYEIDEELLYSAGATQVVTAEPTASVAVVGTSLALLFDGEG
jgi:hypothetical protein